MAADYRVVFIPLDAITAGQVLVERGTPISSVGVLRLPAGTSDTADILFSAGGDPIPLVGVLQSLSRNPASIDGVYYNVRAIAAGQKIAILVGFGVTLESESTGVLNDILEQLQKIAIALHAAPPLP